MPVVVCLQLLLSVNFSFSPSPPSDSIVHWLPSPRQSFWCEGALTNSPRFLPEGVRVPVHLQRCRRHLEDSWEPRSGKISLTVLHPTTVLHRQDAVRFYASFRLPTGFKNPGVFDLKRHFDSMGIVATAFVSDGRFLVSTPSDHSFYRPIEMIREHLYKALPEETPLGSRSFLLALLLGDQSNLTQSLRDLFQSTGTSHLLSISGLHVGLLTGAFIFLLWPVLICFAKARSAFEWGLLASLPVVWLYMAVAGFPIPALRAVWMATPFVLIHFFRWRVSPLDLLAYAAFVILALWPPAVFSVSFQLTFVAVLSLLLGYPPWREWRERRLPSWMRWTDFVAVSVISTLGLLPLLIYHFHTLSGLGVLANALAIPYTEIFLMPWLLLGFWATGVMGLELAFLWKTLLFLSDKLLLLLQGLLAPLSWMVWHGGIALWQMFLYYALVLFFIAVKRHRLKIFCLWLFCTLAAGFRMSMTSSLLTVTFLDVGQGDAAVIELPHGKVWVVDGGGIKGSDWDVGRQVLAPFLWEKNIRRVNGIILTHPHHDHYKGLEHLLKEFHPEFFYWNGDNAPESETEDWENFLKVLKESSVSPVRVTETTPALVEGKVRLTFLAPEAGGTKPYWETNDNSIVARLEYGKASLLLAGDLMALGEHRLLEKKAPLKSTLLKIGHHGSKTSTQEAFLRAVSPQATLLSVGKYNHYGLPDEEVLQRLERSRIVLYRTDEQGAITARTQGEAWKIIPFVPLPNFPKR